jgi:hypothetical protein
MMRRCKERIPIILKHIDWYDFILKSGFIDAYFKYLNCPDHLRDKNLDATKLQYTLLKISKNINSIESFWSQNPEQRLTQVLVNMGIIENAAGAWYYVEETEYMITSHILKPEEILFWGSYGKDGMQELKYILLKDMETEHIEACLRAQKNMNKYYRKTMEKIMRLRKLQKLSE